MTVFMSKRKRRCMSTQKGCNVKCNHITQGLAKSDYTKTALTHRL